MGLMTDIANWDMKSRADIAVIYDRYSFEIGFAGEVVDAISQVDLQRGATWLLKQYLSDGNAISLTQIEAIYSHIDELVHWESKLHILQCSPYLQVSETCLSKVEHFYRVCMKSDRIFVRAWAYSCFFELAAQYPIFQNEATFMLETALETEFAGSVKARIRKVLKKGF